MTLSTEYKKTRLKELLNYYSNLHWKEHIDDRFFIRKDDIKTTELQLRIMKGREGITVTIENEDVQYLLTFISRRVGSPHTKTEFLISWISVSFENTEAIVFKI